MSNYRQFKRGEKPKYWVRSNKLADGNYVYTPYRSRPNSTHYDQETILTSKDTNHMRVSGKYANAGFVATSKKYVPTKKRIVRRQTATPLGFAGVNPFRKPSGRRQSNVWGF